MVEQEGRKPVEINGVIVFENYPLPDGVYNIPNDSETPFVLNVISAQGDKFLEIEDPTAKTNIFFEKDMRFRTYAGGGDFPLIAFELNILKEAFLKHAGQIPPGYKEKERFIDGSKSWSTTKIVVGKKPSSQYIITNIPADDQENNTQFMDIEVKNNGDVLLTRRDMERDKKATMTFKTAENDGKFPIMAEVFTQIAKGMVETQKKANSYRKNIKRKNSNNF